jgi:thioredoxin 1
MRLINSWEVTDFRKSGISRPQRALKGAVMNETLREFTDANFENDVLQSDVPVLVDFWAAWCAPCRRVGPSIEALATEYKATAKIGKLNVDENSAAAVKFGISSIPAVLLFKDGQVVESLVGVRPKERYAQALNQVLSAA